MAESDHLFVYGTLMRDTAHPMAQELARHTRYIGPARLPGRLYMITTYPALVETSTPGEVVHGDLLALTDPGYLAALDDYEECGPDAVDPPPYLREIRTVELDDGRGVDAWVYIYNWPVEESRRIASGRFLSP